MRAGDLKYRIVLRQPAKSTNALGQVVRSTMTDVATVWAGKWSVSTKDVTRQAGPSAQADAKFLIRYRDDITTAMSVLFDGKTYKIVGTEETEDRVGLYLFVRAASE